MVQKQERLLIWFLIIALFVVLLQVAIGGITRLTGSGLSMTEWNIVLGTIPPLNEAEWQTAFTKYKSIPQYNVVNPLMSVKEFKFIYFWEYAHRMWGRFGFLFLFGGFLFFLLKRSLNSKWIWRFIVLLIIYLSQGLLGWFMVKSGLSENIYVSHYRLAAHLWAAILIFAYLAWLVSDLVAKPKQHLLAKQHSGFGLFVLTLLAIQILFGAFMSGLRAAIHYPSWPSMNGKMLPENLLIMKPLFKNFGENMATIHFVHRGLGYLLFGVIVYFFFKIRKSGYVALDKCNMLLPIILSLQIVLGIVVLLSSKGGQISILWASLHQINGLLLFTGFLFIWFLMRKEPEKLAV